MTDDVSGKLSSPMLRVVAVCAIVPAVWLAWYLFVLQPDWARSHRACGAVTAIRGALNNMVYEGLVVPDSVDEITAYARKRGLDAANDIDPWGSPYLFQVVPDPEAGGEGCLRVIVRSLGRNRCDDLGNGDDIQGVCLVWPSLAQRDDKPAAGARQPK